MEHSICYGAIDRESGKQISFARVVTDFGTTYYLCDVIVSPLWQHKGVGRAIIETIQSDPRFLDLRGILVSRDAQGFYARFGFEKSDRGMVKPAANLHPTGSFSYAAGPSLFARGLLPSFLKT